MRRPSSPPSTSPSHPSHALTPHRSTTSSHLVVSTAPHLSSTSSPPLAFPSSPRLASALLRTFAHLPPSGVPATSSAVLPLSPASERVLRALRLETDTEVVQVALPVVDAAAEDRDAQWGAEQWWDVGRAVHQLLHEKEEVKGGQRRGGYRNAVVLALGSATPSQKNVRRGPTLCRTPSPAPPCSLTPRPPRASATAAQVLPRAARRGADGPDLARARAVAPRALQRLVRVQAPPRGPGQARRAVCGRRGCGGRGGGGAPGGRGLAVGAFADPVSEALVGRGTLSQSLSRSGRRHAWAR